MWHSVSSVQILASDFWLRNYSFRFIVCSTQEEILVSTKRKLLYYLAAIRLRIDADKARPVGIQLVTDLRKTSF